jgi:hypothetical protein
MFKTHWCGDDYDFTNDLWKRTYTTPRGGRRVEEFLQPVAGEWYTLWSYVAMNTAGPPSQKAMFSRDGALETWIEGPSFGAVKVLSLDDMAWRQFDNITIDLLYFSVFFGGSSPSFAARKNEWIEFDDFLVLEGRCTPDDEPIDPIVTPILPTWPEQSTKLFEPTDLAIEIVFTKSFTGGACGRFYVTNRADTTCSTFDVHLSVRPSWGGLLTKNGVPSITGLSLNERDDGSGMYTLRSRFGRTAPGAINSKGAFCIRNFRNAKYWLDDLSTHVVAAAKCVSPTGSGANGTNGSPAESPTRPAKSSMSPIASPAKSPKRPAKSPKQPPKRPAKSPKKSPKSPKRPSKAPKRPSKAPKRPSKSLKQPTKKPSKSAKQSPKPSAKKSPKRTARSGARSRGRRSNGR